MTGLIICGVLVVVGFVLAVVGAIGEMRRLAYERDRAETDLVTAWAEIRRLRSTGTTVTHTTEIPVTIPAGTRVAARLRWNA